MVMNLALLALACAVSTVFAAPMVSRDDAPPVTDADVFQFALTLEHLENTFYSGALKKYNAQAFEEAGFAPFVRGRFVQIAEHEAAHVALLTSVLGENATKPCEYNFMYNDPRSFATIASVLETVGGSAYLGAAQFIADKTYLTAAASILAVESRHSAWISSAVLKQQPWNGAYDTPLLPSGVFSLAAQFITSCPDTNPALPVKPFPAFTLSNAAPVQGSQVGVTVLNTAIKSGSAFVAWLDGTQTVYSDIDGKGKTTVPKGLAGTVYAAVVSSKDQAPSDATLVSGFTIVQYPFSSNAHSA